MTRRTLCDTLDPADFAVLTVVKMEPGVLWGLSLPWAPSAATPAFHVEPMPHP